MTTPANRYCRRPLIVAFSLAVHLPLLLLPTAFGVYKLLDEEAKLVSSPKENVVYLFQFPRTSTAPSQAALNIKVETWLHWHGIPFHRISNQFLLGSHSKGTAPFALFSGRYIDGSDAIIREVGTHFGKYKKDEEQPKLRKMIDDELFKILMYDRALSLEWMLGDEGVVEQMTPMVFPESKRITIPLMGSNYNIVLDGLAWSAYFNAYNEPKERNAFMDKFLTKEFPQGEKAATGDEQHGVEPEAVQRGGHPLHSYQLDEIPRDHHQEQDVKKPLKHHKTDQELDHDEGKHGEHHTELGQDQKHQQHGHQQKEATNNYRWEQFDKWFRQNVIERTLSTLFLEKHNGQTNVANPNNAQTKLKRFLKLNKLEGKQVSSYTVEEIHTKLVTRLKMLSGLLEKNEGKGLIPHLEHTPVDASLFGILVQYFETPLQYDKIRSLFAAKSGTLYNFMQSVKQSLGLSKMSNLHRESDGLDGWTKLSERPWMQNFDTKCIFKFNIKEAKYNGPYKLADGNFDPIKLYERVSYKEGKVSFGPLEELEETLPAEVLEVAQELVWLANEEHPMNRYVYVQALLRVLVAYVCEGGKGPPPQGMLGRVWAGVQSAKSTLWGDCTSAAMDEAHWILKEKLEMYSDKKEIDQEIGHARVLAFAVINQWYDAKSGDNVREAIKKVAAVIAGGGEAAENAASSTEYTNEL